MDFNAFINGTKEVDGLKYVASKRFKDKNKPIEWELRPIDSNLDEALRKECIKKVPIPGKRGQFTQELDNDRYLGKMCAASVVYPNLKDAEFQDAFGVKSEDALLKKLLLPGEYTELKEKVMEVNGYDLSMNELVDEAKN